ncbi:MAG TPA: hypothetical protein VNS34_14300 [Rhizobiaceae bacterium]|nr:hypothetical protein [Rhizobiaceae bacterium]
MPKLSIAINDEMLAALDRLILDIEPGLPRELAASAALRNWLVGAGYLPDDDDFEEDLPTDEA